MHDHRMMVRQLGKDEWTVARDIRLDALAGSAPGTFASTFEVASQWSEQQWRQWMDTRLLFVVETDESVLGTAGIMLHDEVPLVVSVWVNPVARGRGASDLLMRATSTWARANGHRELRLWVVDGNHPAEALYLRTGFTYTGRKQRCAADDPRLESEMTLGHL